MLDMFMPQNHNVYRFTCDGQRIWSTPIKKGGYVNRKSKNSLSSVSGVQDSNQEKITTVSGEGMVQSPDFPNTYPRSTELVWRLVAASNMRIQLTFDERFGLEDPEDGICK